MASAKKRPGSKSPQIPKANHSPTKKHRPNPETPADILKQRESLAIFSVKEKLLAKIHAHNSCIIIGETASGKTTQLPQFLHEGGFSRQGTIVVTQPRRVAAVSVATRVAQEVGTELGQLVGYTVRFQDVTSPATKIKYMTDGMLLREALGDHLLKRYSVIVLDEAHERTIHTDVLFGVVKKAQRVRLKRQLPPLKVIVMSATMNVDKFSNYFNKAPVLYLEGRQYHVEVLHSMEPQTDYLFAALVTVFQIHKREPPKSDILVFLTGQEEIEAMVHTINDIAKGMPATCPRLIVHPLYASLPSQQQLRVFQPTPDGCRKVIVSTNIAETSITIRGVKFVVDTGMVKAKTFSAISGLDLLKVQRISKAQAWQRTGRAGRQSAGISYRLYTQQEYRNFLDDTIPEIQRCNLASIVLQLLALGVKNPASFDFMDKPSGESMKCAFTELQLLQAVEGAGEAVCLTDLGRQMASFPLDPKLAKVIMASKDLGCAEEILSVVALLSVDSILFTPQQKIEDAQAIRRKFVSSEGDHITYLNIFRAFRGLPEHDKHKWCYENYVHYRNLNTACNIRQQLRDLCLRANIPLKSCGQDMTSVRKCLTKGLFLNAAELQREGTYITLGPVKHKATFHPSSSLFGCKPAYVLYSEIVQTTRCFLRTAFVIEPEWLYETAPNYFRQSKGANR
ncbi:PREDICTED: putative ATP-dependent RNA helicase DHX33 isoform X2 [Priapulus caudatus]|uniref:RNA helicase n=1 Tax=Priapulus caudatus TaxID=37621 RepID=A0ABM1F965_PRICU|nr:PREDICTED: putative ATP-dependent RNA helicase DHX33 isoform X2 [Priapulus caudatus]